MRWLRLLPLSLLPISVQAQGCSNQCPPINFGQEVNALCEGDVIDSFANIVKNYPVCYPSQPILQNFALQDFRGDNRVTVIANYYSGCNAGRRESGVYAHVAQKYYNIYGADRVMFIQSVKGGGTCDQWADIYQQDATDLYPDSNVVPKEMPLSVNDANYEIRDDLFTTPFGHPSYVILDGDLEIKHKFIGPCCGYESYFDCTADIAKSLDTELTGYLNELLKDVESTAAPSVAPEPTIAPTAAPVSQKDCEVLDFSEWSECSITCGTSFGVEFRWRKVTQLNADVQCPSPIETRECLPLDSDQICLDDQFSCIPEFGNTFTIETVASGFNSPRDVAFHPTPGMHLGNYSEGRRFNSSVGEEAWVVNGNNHSVSIVAALGTEHQTTISRRDRGYYHYMINGTAISFNSVDDSGRTPDRDAYNYWAICNDNENTYIGTKEPNYFMGPTLYNSDPKNRNLVNRIGEVCGEEEPCYFLHADMLHEAPACTGIVHDPEVATAYGNVFWAFDATGNRQNGQLVKFDFQQPHGPGSMDHSVASVRRYPEVELKRGPDGIHSGMIVHPTRREVYIAVPGANKIIVVDADSGEFARTAREEYPIYSNRLPSFEYSVWECAIQRVFAADIEIPTGMALSADGERLFVAERSSGRIFVYEIASGSLLYKIETAFKSIGGMALSPKSNELYFVDDQTNTLNKVKVGTVCSQPFSSRLNPNFDLALEQAKQELGDGLSLYKNYKCTVNPVIPDSSFFDQVHNATGYADDNPDVQAGMGGMDASAALLANRTDCGYDSDLNFDALLLGGYYCHVCLPEQDLTCDSGGSCTNVQWIGYTCDNEFFVSIKQGPTIEFMMANGANKTVVDSDKIVLKRKVTYRFTVLENADSLGLCFSIPSKSKESAAADETICATKGPLMVSIDDNHPSEVFLFVEGYPDEELSLEVEDRVDNSGVETDDESNTPSFFSKTAIAGYAIAATIAIGTIALICLDKKITASKEAQNSETIAEEGRSPPVSSDSPKSLVPSEFPKSPVSPISHSGPVSSDSPSGPMSAGSPSGPVSADSPSGPVSADSPSDPMSADSPSGPVSADSSSDPVSAD